MPGGLYNPRQHIHFPRARIYNAAAPVAYTDLDLSSIVGVRQCLVLLRFVKNVHTAATIYSVRTNGDAAGPFAETGAGVCYSGDTSRPNTSIAMTDGAGIIEWYAINNDSVSVYVEAFIHA